MSEADLDTLAATLDTFRRDTLAALATLPRVRAYRNFVERPAGHGPDLRYPLAQTFGR